METNTRVQPQKGNKSEAGKQKKKKKKDLAFLEGMHIDRRFTH